MSDEVIQHLCHKIFIGTSDGKKLLELLKNKEISNPVFPQPVENMDVFGGALGWAGFRAGHRNFIMYIEELAKQHEQQMEAQNKKG